MTKTVRFLVPGALLALSLSLPVVALAGEQHVHGWRVRCERDAMHDRVMCSADRQGLVIGLMSLMATPTPWARLLGDTDAYPGTTCYVRVDTIEALPSQDTCKWVGDRAVWLVDAMQRGQQLRTRYTAWPSKVPVEAQVSLAGFPAVWAALQAAYAAQ
jgi:hypothetical protein